MLLPSLMLLPVSLLLPVLLLRRCHYRRSLELRSPMGPAGPFYSSAAAAAAAAADRPDT